tara:strand:- start:38 stop:244 length:207 start_codon:yes stop_codon:yes gene_type:complete
MHGYFNDEEIKQQSFLKAKETLEKIANWQGNNCVDKLLEVADAKVLYSMVLLMLNKGLPNLTARNMFA